MTITFPLSIPATDQIEASFTLFPENAIAVSESQFTFQQQVQAHDGDRWILEMGLPIMNRTNAAQWYAFLLKLRGRFGTFLWGPKLLGTTQGSGSGTPLVNGGSQTGYTLVTDGWTPGAANVLKAGDMFQVGNNLYTNLNDVSADGGGNATLDIWPRARDHADNDSLDTTAPKGIFRLMDNAPRAISFDSLQKYSVKLRATEAK